MSPWRLFLGNGSRWSSEYATYGRVEPWIREKNSRQSVPYGTTALCRRQTQILLYMSQAHLSAAARSHTRNIISNTVYMPVQKGLSTKASLYHALSPGFNGSFCPLNDTPGHRQPCCDNFQIVNLPTTHTDRSLHPTV